MMMMIRIMMVRMIWWWYRTMMIMTSVSRDQWSVHSLQVRNDDITFRESIRLKDDVSDSSIDRWPLTLLPLAHLAEHSWPQIQRRELTFSCRLLCCCFFKRRVEETWQPVLASDLITHTLSSHETYFGCFQSGRVALWNETADFHKQGLWSFAVKKTPWHESLVTWTWSLRLLDHCDSRWRFLLLLRFMNHIRP